MKNIAERNSVIRHVMDSSSLEEAKRTFLLNYLQFEKDLSNTYILYPVQMGQSRIVFKKGRLFGKNSKLWMQKLLAGEVMDMIYCYAKFKKDMSFATSEKLSVNIFLRPAIDTDNNSTKNLVVADLEKGLASSGLKKLCQQLLSA